LINIIKATLVFKGFYSAIVWVDITTDDKMPQLKNGIRVTKMCLFLSANVEYKSYSRQKWLMFHLWYKNG
jgi:hypothetical protein